MINVNDLVPADNTKLYRYAVVNNSGVETGEYLFLKYSPGELSLTPTPINRYLLMAMQGFIANTTVFNDDGSITETNANSETLVTVFNTDGSITQTFTAGTQVLVKNITFSATQISEVMSS